ncbi:hypothetical protein COB72_05625 [bacterium]|nr:MAG: hypothetical protein COB72_05625 [bacterium]
MTYPSLNIPIEILNEDERDGAIAGFRTDMHTILVRDRKNFLESQICELYHTGCVLGSTVPECSLIDCFDLTDLESIIPLLTTGREVILNRLEKKKAP